MLDFYLFSLDGGPHHWTSLILHALSSILLFAVLLRTTRAFWRAALVAGFFALHPLRVESVAWIAERKDTLSTFFFMLTILGYARYVERPNALRYLSVLAALALGMMSKPMVVTLPFVLLLLDFWPLQRINRENAKWRVAEKMPMLIMSAAVSVINFILQQRAGAVVSLNLRPLPVRIENALISYVAYLRMLIWPVNLAPIYPFPAMIPVWEPVAAAIVLAAISVLVFSKRLSHKYLVVGWLWYLGTLVPVIGIVQVGEQALADRYTYVPLIGILLMLVWGLADLQEDYPKMRRLSPLAAVAGLGLCIGLSVKQVSYWRNTETLFTHTIAVTDNNYVAYNALGAMMLAKDKPADALPYLAKAIEYNPRFIAAQINMGISLDELGRASESLSHFQTALQVEPQNADAQAGLGVELTEAGAGDEGLAHAREAVRLEPSSSHEYFQLGRVYGLLQQFREAEHSFRKSVELDPSYAQAHYNLGLALGRQGKLAEAAEAFRIAVQLKPEYVHAWYDLGNALAQQGFLKEAAPAFATAVRLQPDFLDARNAFATAEELLRHGPH
jgi:tetratricopeptide (TPR) repeat protein